VNLIRVLMANQPRLIRELVTATISDQPDIEVVGEVQQDSELESLVESKQPDVLIVALDRTKELPRLCQAILRGHPQMRVIAIAPDRNSSMVYWTSAHIEKRAIETSEAGVLGAIRSETSTAERLQ
jgi:DNA-binding NarL/FixJ family response regulator